MFAVELSLTVTTFSLTCTNNFNGLLWAGSNFGQQTKPGVQLWFAFWLFHSLSLAWAVGLLVTEKAFMNINQKLFRKLLILWHSLCSFAFAGSLSWCCCYYCSSISRGTVFALFGFSLLGFHQGRWVFVDLDGSGLKLDQFQNKEYFYLDFWFNKFSY